MTCRSTSASDSRADAPSSCLNETLETRRQLQRDESPEYAVTLRNLGLVAQREGRLDDAQRLIEKGRDLLARKQGVRGAEYTRTMQLLGELLAARGDDAAALTALENILDIRRTTLGLDHPDTAVTLRALADVLRRKGRETEACEALRGALPYRCLSGTWGLTIPGQSSCVRSRSLALRTPNES